MSGVTAPSSSLDRFTGRDLGIIFSSLDPFLVDEVQHADVPKHNRVKKMPPTKEVVHKANMMTPVWSIAGGLDGAEADSKLLG